MRFCKRTLALLAAAVMALALPACTSAPAHSNGPTEFASTEELASYMAQQADAEENQIALFEPQTAHLEADLDTIQLNGNYVYYEFFLDGYEPAPEGEVAGSGQAGSGQEESPSSESSVPPEGGQGNQKNTPDQTLRHTLTIGWNTTPGGEACLEEFVSENSGQVTAVEGCPGVYQSDAMDGSQVYGKVFYWTQDDRLFEATVPEEAAERLLEGISQGTLIEPVTY